MEEPTWPLDVPGYRRVLPGKTTPDPVDDGLLSERRPQKSKDQKRKEKNRPAYSCQKAIHDRLPVCHQPKLHEIPTPTPGIKTRERPCLWSFSILERGIFMRLKYRMTDCSKASKNVNRRPHQPCTPGLH